MCCSDQIQYAANTISKIKDAIQTSCLNLIHFIRSAYLEQYKGSNLINSKGDNPCHRQLEEGGGAHPCPTARLLADSSQSRRTWDVEQTEHHQAEGVERAEDDGGKEWNQLLSQYGPKTLGHIRRIALGAEVQQEPDGQCGNKNRGASLFQIILDFLPDIDGHRPGIGQFILRQLNHQVVDALFSVQQVDDSRHHNGDHDADQVHGIGHHHGIIPEKHLGKQDINGQPGIATHEGCHQHDLETVPFVFQRAGGHNSRDGTAKAQKHRDEGFAEKPQLANGKYLHLCKKVLTLKQSLMSEPFLLNK